MRHLPILACCVLLTACGSRTVNVTYDPEAASAGGDWYPIPLQQERTVTSAERDLERPPVTLAEPSDPAGDPQPLSVTESRDSFGNVSLEVNRGASLTWELLDSVVTRLGWPVADRNRSEYRLELRDVEVAAPRGLLARLGNFFSGERKPVHLILVPRVGVTSISAEYADGQVLTGEDNQRLMAQLQEELQQGG